MERMQINFFYNFKNDDSIDEIEKIRIMQNDWQVERYLRKYKKEEIAYKAMVKALKWKNWFGINGYYCTDFPREFYEHFMPIKFGKDKSNHAIYWQNPKHKMWENNFNNEILLTSVNRFSTFVLNMIDKEIGRNGIVFVLDFNGQKLIDDISRSYSTFKFLLKLLEIYPELIKYIILIDLPNIQKYLLKYFLLYSDLRIKMRPIKRENLRDLFSIDNILHDEIAQNLINASIPEEVKKLYQLQNNLELTDNSVDSFYQKYHQINHEFHKGG